MLDLIQEFNIYEVLRVGSQFQIYIYINNQTDSSHFQWFLLQTMQCQHHMEEE